ncbi:hypothetical protein ONR57_14225 [Hoyosella sp. YIM 151337]|uniref:hypothetical protein n=1 Tax=Hoyosella sp. YIM 151337 TaxID=2992742 RepID=UPI002236BF6E|nr:hypothetical protein [Hoyosella sp. YIM 151337]MCW4354462.1 hypothetical protein [Hoyosella sp. YIM 151337]
MSSSVLAPRCRSAFAAAAAASALSLLLAGCGDEPAAPGPYGGARDATATASPLENEDAAPGTDHFSFVAEDGRRVDGDARITTQAGRTVILEVTSNTPEELHVHGYDLYADIEPGGTVQLEFVADLPGIFEVELHHAHVVLTQLRVDG